MSSQAESKEPETLESIKPEIENYEENIQIEFKPGQKYPTPSPGNGGECFKFFNPSFPRLFDHYHHLVYLYLYKFFTFFIIIVIYYLDRVFYETLLKQNPNSEMAQDWCLAYGILEFDEAKKLNDYVMKRKGKNGANGAKKNGNTSSPQKKPPASSNNGGGAKTKAKRAKIIDDDGVEVDSGIGLKGIWESQTSMDI